MFSLGRLLLWLAVMVGAMWQLVPHSEQLWRESAVILSPHKQSLIHSTKRWLLGVRSSSPTWPEGQTWLVATHGVLSVLWRTVVSASLIVAAAVWFEGAGIALAAGAVFAWFVQPLWRGLRFVLLGSRFERPNRVRFLAIATCAAASVAWLLTSVTTWHSLALPGVVESVDAAIVRAESPGFVEEVCVESGQAVRDAF